MIDFSISLLPLLVLSVVNFFLSWIWYSPLLFAKPWMKALGISPDREFTETEMKKIPFLFISGIIASFLLIYGMMVLIHSMGITQVLAGMVVGVIFWAAFALTHSLSTLWEGRKPIVLIINNSLFLLTYAGFGGLLAIWR